MKCDECETKAKEKDDRIRWAIEDDCINCKWNGLLVDNFKPKRKEGLTDEENIAFHKDLLKHGGR